MVGRSFQAGCDERQCHEGQGGPQQTVGELRRGSSKPIARKTQRPCAAAMIHSSQRSNSLFSFQLVTGPAMRARARDHERRGLTIVEMLVVIAAVGILAALLLPAVLAAREAARRTSCTANLKQIALATASYADVWGSLPAGVHFTFNYSTASQHVAILPFIEQPTLFNAVNFDWVIWSAANTTVMSARLEVYQCPSDPLASSTDVYRGDLFFEPGHDFFYYGAFDVAYSSYAGNAGTWFQHSRNPSRLAQCNGLFHRESATRLAAITDGLSSTVFYAEHAVSLLTDETERIAEGPQWAGGWYGSTICTSFYPINPEGKVNDVYGDGLCRAFIGAVSSRHPGGANAAFVDGSVKFIKDTIDSWAVDASRATPLGITRDTLGLFQLAPETRFHVWQVLTTGAGNEVISASGF
jgi:prepilin-type processing-associated H-X9-DG protein/prepilin-type N-terminal cleavage/methylation domain-containing protein